MPVLQVIFPVTCAIIIPTRDRPAGLRAAVASALAALPPGGRVVVVDDGSDPPAGPGLAEFAAAPVETVVNQGPHGAAAARNFGMRACDAEIVFFLDDDDTMEPDYPARILAALAGPGRAARFGFSAMQRGRRVVGKRLDPGMIPPEAPLSERLAGLGMGFWIRRATFLEVGGIDAALPVNEDTEFFLRLAAQGVPGWYSPAPGVRIRPAPAAGLPSELDSLTRRSRAAERAGAFEHILTRHARFLENHPALRRMFLRRVIKYRIRAGEPEAARAAAGAEPAWFHRRALLGACALHALWNRRAQAGAGPEGRVPR